MTKGRKAGKAARDIFADAQIQQLTIEDFYAAVVLTSMRRGGYTTIAEIRAMREWYTSVRASGKVDDIKIQGGHAKSGVQQDFSAPKTTPAIDKQNRILAYLQSSLTVHSIKELEKVLPSVASINGVVVKDFLQALTDDGKIHVEKIGSGNWYWSFASEEKKARENTMAKLQEEKTKFDAALEDLQGRVKEANALKGDDPDRESLVERRLVLEHEVGGLRKELEGYKDGDLGEVERRRKEIAGIKSRTERWTDNIGILEGQMLNSLGGDREKLEGIKREVYGNEYVEGEGLREL